MVIKLLEISKLFYFSFLCFIKILNIQHLPIKKYLNLLNKSTRAVLFKLNPAAGQCLDFDLSAHYCVAKSICYIKCDVIFFHPPSPGLFILRGGSVWNNGARVSLVQTHNT